MGVKIIGTSYANLPYSGGSTGFLFDNSGQLIKEKIVIEFDFSFESSQSESVTYIDDFTLQLNGGDWASKGLFAGDTIEINGQYTDQNGNTYIFPSGFTRTIGQVVGNQLIVTTSLDPGLLPAWPLDGVVYPTTGSATNLVIINNTRSVPEELVLFHNLQPNDANQSDSSIIDGEVNKFAVEDIDSMAVSDSLNLTQLGNKSGGLYFGTQTINRNADVGGKKRFQINLTYFLPDIEDASFDEPDWFDANSCLKATYRFVGYPQANNPNSAIETKFDSILGNTGWYNEEHNQGVNEFTVSNVSIVTASGNSVSKLDPNQNNTITATVTGSANFANFAEAKFSIIPPTSDYKNNSFSHLENTYTSHFFKPGASPVVKSVSSKNGGEVDTSGHSVDVSTSNEITVEFTLEPNTDFTNYINSLPEAERLYRLSLTVASDGGTAGNNNAVSLILLESTFEAEPIIGQPYPPKKAGFFEHSQDITGTIQSTYNGRTEDDFLYYAKLDLTKNEEWDTIRTRINVVRNSDDVIITTLESFDFPLASIPIVGGIIQMNYEQTLDQKLDAPNRNVASLKLTGNDTVDDYEVEMIISLLANWRYWIAKSNSLNDFFNINLPNDGQNSEWMRYLRLAGYRIEARTELIKDNIADYFVNQIVLDDYEDNLVSPDVTTTISILDDTPAVINALPNNQVLTIRADHVLASGSWPTSDTYGFTCIRGNEEDPRPQISTVWNWSSQNGPLKPLSGETKAKLTFPAANTARVECLVNTTQLPNGINDVVARIKSPIAPTCQHPIDFVFDYVEANAATDADIVDTYNALLNTFGTSPIDANICCPTCDKTYTDLVYGTYTAYAIGAKADVQNIIDAADDGDDPVCCYDANKETSSYTSCDGSFDANIAAINAIVTGDTSYIDNTLIQTQINSYSGVTELTKLKDRLEALTTDETIRYDLYREIIERGLIFRCKDDGTKYLSRL